MGVAKDAFPLQIMAERAGFEKLDDNVRKFKFLPLCGPGFDRTCC